MYHMKASLASRASWGSPSNGGGGPGSRPYEAGPGCQRPDVLAFAMCYDMAATAAVGQQGAGLFRCRKKMSSTAI